MRATGWEVFAAPIVCCALLADSPSEAERGAGRGIAVEDEDDGDDLAFGLEASRPKPERIAMLAAFLIDGTSQTSSSSSAMLRSI
jgi:hypothetical protein